MGFGSFLSSIPFVGDVFSGLTGTAQAQSQQAVAGIQANISQASVESQERMFDKSLEFEKEKLAAFNQEAANQKGIVSSPLATKPTSETAKKPSLSPAMIALAIAGFFMFKKKRGKL